MKMIPIGIYDEDGDALCLMKASDFSDRNYEGIQLRKTKQGMPVIILQSRKTAPLMWKVSTASHRYSSARLTKQSSFAAAGAWTW